MATFRIPKPLCRAHAAPDIDDGTLCRGASFPPGPTDWCLTGALDFEFPTWHDRSLAGPDPLETRKEDGAEFKLLKGKITDKTVEQYIAHRDKFFGSREEYLRFAAESDAELDGTKNLRKLIELKGEAQTVFYRWVRKAYIDKGIADVPALIRRGLTDAMKKELEAIKAAYGGDFQYGGFNPRPMKDAQYRYRLGTISEHGTGTAVDIESKRNPILSSAEWAFIEQLAGKKVDSTLHRWKSAPDAVWTDVKALNDEFVKKVAAKVKEIEDAAKAAAPAAGKPAGKPVSAIDQVLGSQPKLKDYKDGFFTLEQKLVKLLHDHGFTWGVTFRYGKSPSADLHHFEL